MKLKIVVLFSMILTLSGFTYLHAAFIQPQKIDFDWRFHLGDVKNGQDPTLNTSSWRLLDLPHDWSIEGQHSIDNPAGQAGAFLPCGIGWYRKDLNWDKSWENKKVKIHFEGIYLNSDVWINGHLLGHRPNGYIGIEYDLTDYLIKGKNVIAVRVDHEKVSTGRWYTGSGIYRHVWLKVENSLHIDNWGVHFTSPNVSSALADFVVEVSLSNQGLKTESVKVQVALLNKAGLKVSETTNNIDTKQGELTTIKLKGTLKNPALWFPENPELYRLQTTLIQNGKEIDRDEQKIGFRKLEFDGQFGFKLNGKVTKLKGVCDHHTAGSVGAAVPDDVLLSRLRLLKKMGCNAIRTSHNPFSPSFYNICDSIGLMVMNEFSDGWDKEKAPFDYGIYFDKWWNTDGIDFIKRDRNHPSVVIWSIGNEVSKPTREVQKQLVDMFHQYDPTRPVTQGGIDPTRGMKGDNLPSLLDVKGFNGDGEEKNVFEDFHAKEPNMPMIGTEVPHTYQTRGVYRSQTQWRRRDFPATWEMGQWDGTLRGYEDRIFPIPDLAKEEVFPEEKCSMYYQNGKQIPIEITRAFQPIIYYQSSYDNASVRSSARMAWQRTRDLSYVMGQFRWGSYDYLGETNEWPSRFANFGVIDICGFPKDHFYLYQSMWTEQPMVHMLPHWTHTGKEGVKIPMVVYTNCDEVEMFLNGKSLGNQKYTDEQLVWMVPYEPGIIKAVAKKNGKVVAEDVQVTAANAAKIKLSTDRNKIIANRTDVVQIAVDILDAKGVFCPNAIDVIEFEVSGPAKIIGVDNGDPIDLSDYKTNVRRAFHGKVMLLIQSTGNPGNISVKATSKLLKSDNISIVANKIH